MRILLDECLPRRLKSHLAGHAIQTVPEAGWSGRKNGDLLRLAAGKFDVFVTIDQNLAFQQNLSDAQVAVVLIVSGSSRYEDLRPLVPKLLEAIQTAKSGELTRVGA